ncbi:MAG: IS4 family transposase [Planctomycetota bacterium]|nr:MAG: IS4 family transposase [Planctomycetota bacterium]REJ89767.1 MAG: IS4 family transposase [Planctomycetota bacterium]REK25220.1 MAG: IS4 family transposase [Planctomycetota bacterium]
MARKLGRNAYRRDLIAEFDALFPPQLFRGLPSHGNREWTPRMVVWVSLIMFWVSGNTLEEQFSAARRIVKFLRPDWRVPVSYSGFAVAQQHWWPLVGSLLMARLRPDESAGKAWRVLGWLVLAVDGSRFECPRTTANEAGLGCAGRNKTAPQLFHTLLQHVGTGLPWDFRIGPGTDSERRHLEDMLADLPEQTLLTADAGFTGYDLCSQLIDANQRFVLRIGGNKTLLENLEDDESDEDIVYLWPQKQQSQSQPALKLRRICFRSAGNLPVVLITNMLDPNVLSDEDAQAIYQSRWGIEVYFRHLKQTMGFTTLKSRTPMTAMNEHHWRLISFWTLQHIAVRHQLAAGQAPHRFSAARARNEIRDVLQLMQQGRRGPPLAQRWLTMQTDTYQRHGPKTTREWPRKKNDKPPSPPKCRTATTREIKRAKELGFKFLLIS